MIYSSYESYSIREALSYAKKILLNNSFTVSDY